MSYDVVLVPRRDGQRWEHALDEMEQRADSGEPLGDLRVSQWGAIERRLRERAGDIDVFADDTMAEATFTVGLQVSLFADEASVSYTYWDQEDPDAFHALVVDVVRIVEEETGSAAWDPQTDQPFDGTPGRRGRPRRRPEAARRGGWAGEARCGRRSGGRG